MKVYKGSILSVNKNDDVFNFLVEDNGRIVYVGNKLPNEYKEAEVIDLKDQALTPSFVDTHQHFASFSIFHSGLNVMDAENNKEIQEMIKEFVNGKKIKSLICFGASPYSVSDKRLITREELDEVAPNIEVAVIKYDGHASIVNTKLLNKIKNKVEKLRGYHPDTGEMNQEAFFAVSHYITGSVSVPNMIKAMQEAMDYQAARGIGMVHTVSGVGFPLNLDINIEKWMAKSAQNGFQIRVFPQSMNVKVALNRKFSRIGGCFECALDGCFGSQDASMNEPYEGSDNSGVLYYSDEKVIEFCKKANRLGLQIEMHAIGDKAFDQATRCLKAALDDFPRKDHRHGIIHDCLPTKEGLKICEEYGIVMPIQTSFINWKQEPDEYLESLLGKERAARLNPVKDFFDHNIVVGAGSDAPCTDPDPIVWIDKAVNHTVKEQSITVQQALRMCTYNGYYITFDEKERGSLEVGKYADMVILSKNPYEVKKEELKDIKVMKTILQGKEYKPQSQSVLKAVTKGMVNKTKF